MPFGPYKDFAECVKKNKGKGNPEAYCASIERNIKESKNKTRNIKMAGHEEPKESKDKDQKKDNEKKKPIVKVVNGKCPEGYDKKGGLCFLKKSSKDKDKAKDTKEGSKMEDSSEITSKEKSLFSDNDQISKLKAVIVKLEQAESLEAAKLLVVELKAFVPAEASVEVPKADEGEAKKEEPAKEEVEDKETVTGAEGESKVAEAIKETKTEAVATSETQLAEALDLNQKMISKLEDASTQIGVLEKINTKLTQDKVDLSKQLTVFLDDEEAQEKAKHQSKFNDVFNKYCQFMNVPESEQKTVEKQMSTFSEDMLDNTLRYVENKEQTMMESEPVIETEPSSDLSDKEQTVMTTEKYSTLNAREKTDYLFSKIQQEKI